MTTTTTLTKATIKVMGFNLCSASQKPVLGYQLSDWISSDGERRECYVSDEHRSLKNTGPEIFEKKN